MAVIDRVEDKLYSRRNAEFIEDPKQILLYRVLAQLKRLGDLAIAQTVGHEKDHLLLARGKKFFATMIEDAQGWLARDAFEDIVHLLGIGPDLAAGHAVNTFP